MGLEQFTTSDEQTKVKPVLLEKLLRVYLHATAVRVLAPETPET